VWVLAVLKQLQPSDIEKVILRLVDPREYKGVGDDFKQAVQSMNEILIMGNLAVGFDNVRPYIKYAEPLKFEGAEIFKATTKDEAEFHGEFVNFDKIWSYPKPLQKPHPPVLMGGHGPTTFDRVIEFCDGWMPIGFRLTNIAEKIATLRQRAEQAGRDPQSISITIFAAKPEPGAIEELQSAGVERAVFMLPPADRDTVLPLLDKYGKLME